MITNAVEYFPSYKQISESFEHGNFIFKVIYIALLGTLLEEIIFRGVVLRFLSKKMKITAAVTIQALVFGVIHMNICTVCMRHVFGVAAGLVFIWLDSIRAAVAVHFSFNMVSIIMLELLGDLETDNAAIDATITVVGSAVVAGALYVLYKNKPVCETWEQISIETLQP